MIRGPLLRLVLLISCAHALVHMYELSVPSVEQEIALDYFPTDAAAGKQATGWLSMCWRFPFGMGAFFAGWLVDRYGSRRMLALYLLGCAACSLSLLAVDSLAFLFVPMFAMGALASIYHPAGLGLISHETSPEQLPKALGIHGVFGSAGIALAPFVAAFALGGGVSWRVYYALLAIPGLALGLVFLSQIGRDQPAATSQAKAEDSEAQDRADWVSFFLLTLLAVLQGMVYSAVLSFLPRYLTEFNVTWGVSAPRLIASGVLLVGCIGQYIAGRAANPQRLELQLTAITWANSPCLVWLAFAEGRWRAVAAAVFALVHFMHQPIYNSLIAKYTPKRRRSLCYGFSFAMGLGLGGIGAVLAGYSYDGRAAHLVLAGLAAVAGGIGLILWRRNRPANAR